MKKIITIILNIASFSIIGQHLQYFKPNNKQGLNIFETTKSDSNVFSGFHVKIGGNFTQDYQGLSHENIAVPVLVGTLNTNKLAAITNNFNLAMANLNIDAQLADGVRMNLTMYLSSRHHEETWVKGGYIQIDKLPFFKSEFLDKIMKNVTIKAGDYEIDYGDQHYRRTDGGNAIHNPFVENYIMDAFATEIGTEVYFHPKNGFVAMLGITNGQLNPSVLALSKIDSATGKINTYTPAYHGKIGFDKQFTNHLRLRLMGSFYTDKSATSNTLFFGDRTGSHYYFVMENTTAGAVAQAWSGRYNPKYNEQVNTIMINPFLKYKGIEFFGSFEIAKGRTITEKKMRKTNQFAADLIYRFPANKENFWIGTRYNSVKAELLNNTNVVNINRLVGSMGWFITQNIMLKGEYVQQEYKNFPSNNILSGGKFKGYMIAATIGF